MKKTFVLVVMAFMVISVWSFPWDKKGSSGNSPRDVLQGVKGKIEEKTSSKVEASISPEALRAELEKKWLEAGKVGYDHMPWGTTVEDVRRIYPNINKLNNPDGDAYGFEQWRRGKKSDDQFWDYWFYNGKLIFGQTAWAMALGDQLADDINHGLKELYGEPTDIQDSTEHRTETYLGKYTASYDYGLMLVTWEKGDFRIQQRIQIWQGDTQNDRQIIMMCVSRVPQVVDIKYFDVPSVNELMENEESYFKEKEEREQKERVRKLGL